VVAQAGHAAGRRLLQEPQRHGLHLPVLERDDSRAAVVPPWKVVDDAVLIWVVPALVPGPDDDQDVIWPDLPAFTAGW